MLHYTVTILKERKTHTQNSDTPSHKVAAAAPPQAWPGASPCTRSRSSRRPWRTRSTMRPSRTRINTRCELRVFDPGYLFVDVFESGYSHCLRVTEGNVRHECTATRPSAPCERARVGRRKGYRRSTEQTLTQARLQGYPQSAVFGSNPLGFMGFGPPT